MIQRKRNYGDSQSQLKKESDSVSRSRSLYGRPQKQRKATVDSHQFSSALRQPGNDKQYPNPQPILVFQVGNLESLGIKSVHSPALCNAIICGSKSLTRRNIDRRISLDYPTVQPNETRTWRYNRRATTIDTALLYSNDYPRSEEDNCAEGSPATDVSIPDSQQNQIREPSEQRSSLSSPPSSTSSSSFSSSSSSSSSLKILDLLRLTAGEKSLLEELSSNEMMIDIETSTEADGQSESQEGLAREQNTTSQTNPTGEMRGVNNGRSADRGKINPTSSGFEIMDGDIMGLKVAVENNDKEDGSAAADLDSQVSDDEGGGWMEEFVDMGH